MNTFIVIGFCCWGRGTTIKEAKKIALKSAGREAKKDNWYAYLTTDPKAFVDDFGGVRFKAGTTCERLGQI